MTTVLVRAGHESKAPCPVEVPLFATRLASDPKFYLKESYRIEKQSLDINVNSFESAISRWIGRSAYPPATTPGRPCSARIVCVPRCDAGDQRTLARRRRSSGVFVSSTGTGSFCGRTSRQPCVAAVSEASGCCRCNIVSAARASVRFPCSRTISWRPSVRVLCRQGFVCGHQLGTQRSASISHSAERRCRRMEDGASDLFDQVEASGVAL